MTESFSSVEELNSLIADFQAQSVESDKVEIVTTVPPKDVITLPGGFITSDGKVERTVKLKELTGADEEEISKTSGINRIMNIVFSRGLLQIGDVNASKENLDDMLSGDRDSVLLGIRKLTFGNEIPLSAVCPSCSRLNELVIDLDKDVKEHTLDDPIADRLFKVSIKDGEALVSLPNGYTNKKLLDAENMTTAELVTIVLAGCIVSINGATSLGVQTALSLGIVDRENIISEIYKRTPGPRLGEVTKACEACGTDIPVPLSLAALFRL